MAKRYGLLFLLCYGIWCVLNWLPEWQALVLGLPVAALVAWLTVDLPTASSGLTLLEPSRFWYFCAWYLPVFWWECLKANIDMAYRVLHPRLPICPAVVRVQTGLRSDLALMVLANSISLTPGTTSVDVNPEKGILYVHCMLVSPAEVEKEATLIVQRFARILRKVFE